MFKFWRQRELHAKEVAICECAPQTSGLRDQSPVRDMEKKNNKKNNQKQKNKQTNKQTKKTGESNYTNNSNLYRISYNKVDK